MSADPRIDRYLSKDRPWLAELRAYRAILLDEGLEESLKWRQPCYAAHGSNVALLAAMKAACAVSFLRGALLDDPKGILVSPGPNSRFARMLKVTSVEEIREAESDLRGFIRQAVEAARTGTRVEASPDLPEIPAELTEALTDPELRVAWEALTPGRRRGYLVTLTQAKRPDTRRARIEKWRPRILAGQGLHDR